MYEYDSNDSDNDTYRPKQSRQSPTPKNGRSVDGSACPPVLVDQTPHSVPMAAQVSSDSPPMDVDATRHPDPMVTQISSDRPLPVLQVVDPSEPAALQSVLTPAQPEVASDCSAMDVDLTPLAHTDLTATQISSDRSPMPVTVDLSDPAAPQSVPTPAQVTSDCPPMLIDSRDPTPC